MMGKVNFKIVFLEIEKCLVSELNIYLVEIRWLMRKGINMHYVTYENIDKKKRIGFLDNQNSEMLFHDDARVLNVS